MAVTQNLLQAHIRDHFEHYQQRTAEDRQQEHTPEQSGHRFRHYPDTLSVLIRTPIPG